MTQFEIDVILTQKLVNFQKSAQELLRAWEELDHTGQALSDDYPFEDSFETIVHNINKWVETQNNLGKL